ncbi:MAG TPA: insulinase family protein [Candidatus Luteococcus avicola]|nr:insulinase family protein [Candidatus Luteococcus avicola]
MSTRPERPQIGEPAPWDFPSPRVRELDNGLAVWLFDLPGQHVVTAELCLDIPLAVEPVEHEGVAMIALRVSDEGTTTHPDGEVLDLLEACGAAYDGGAGTHATHCSLDVPAPRLRRAMELFAEIVRTPAIAAADVERHVALRLAEIEQARISPGSLASLGLKKVLYAHDDRSSRPTGGSATSVATITTDLVRAFHDQWWRPAGAVLVVAGDLPHDVDAIVDACFADWTGPDSPAQHQAPRHQGAATASDGRPVVHLMDRPGAVQAELRLFGPSVGRGSDVFAPLQVACTAMGGSFGSRLNHLLREDRGYTYGVSMSTSPGRDQDGQWSMGGSFRTEVAVAALGDALDTLFSNEHFTTDEVSDAITYQVGIAPLRYATAEGVAAQAISLASVGREPGYVNEHFARIRAVTPEAATDAFSQVITPASTRALLVGDALELRPALEAAGYQVCDLSALTD